MKCPNCAAELPQGATKCTSCGALIVRGKYCPHCRAVIPLDAKTCPQCKKSIAADNGKKPLTKRWWFWTVAAVLVIGIIGNIGNAINPGKAAPASSAVSSQAPITNPFLLPEVEVQDVNNGVRTEKIGEWACIHMKKGDAKTASEEEFAQFAAASVNGSGYKWWSVIFEDGTGICFTGSHTYASTYGKLDEEGCIAEALGDISMNEKTAHTSYTPRKEKPAPTPEPTPASELETTPPPTEPPAPEVAITPKPTPPAKNETSSASSGGGSSNQGGSTQSPVIPQPPATQEPTAPPVQQEPSQQAQDGVVYWAPTENGKKYHSTASCRTLRNSATIASGTVEEAINSGRGEPCKVCH